ncbi:hypothetical protein EX349_31340 [Pseudomonas protegens]|uniref:hypothetical protein n=1 Tax=Pseudomonas protegens TaxID=380021 RepID=UPI0013730BBE|nr:hypothetical protein [Pseudomonas protegens]NAN55685.1 hypothetical protein [Pseudomonas protegens]NUE78722.1 hypothetical protein [Pseudomonas protegens]
MITEFSMHDSFLASPSFQDVNSSLAHDVFLNNWRSYGVLVAHPGQLANFQKEILALPVKFKSRWQTAFTDALIYNIVNDSPNIETMNSFDETKTLATFYSTLFLEENLSFILCENDEIIRYCDDTGFELVGAPSLSSSVNISRSIDACETDISDRDEIDIVWRERFSNLAKHSKKIFISDRYVFRRLLYDVEKGVATTSIMKFFSYLLQEGGEYYVTIASDGGRDQSQTFFEVTNYFDRLLNRRPDYKNVIKRLTLISNDESVFQRHAHDRYIRFEKHICEMGNGMSLFEHHPLSNMSFNIKLHHRTNVAKIEKELRDDPYWTAVITS